MAHVETSARDALLLRGVRVHNLQNVDVDLPLGKLIAISGVSGAGKTSLAFDTIYAEAQRRYLQSFSVHTRQYLERFDKPDADFISDLPPALAFHQRRMQPGPRATVGSLTEIADFLQLIFARAGQTFCPQCGQEIKPRGTQEVFAAIVDLPPQTRLHLGFPSLPDEGEDIAAWGKRLQEDGFLRVQIGSDIIRLGEQPLPPSLKASPYVILDRFEAGKISIPRLRDSIETAFNRGRDRLALLSESEILLFDRRRICPTCDLAFPPLEPRLFDCDDPLGACPACHGTGLDAKTDATCDACQGQRWNLQALSVRWQGRTIADVSRLPLREVLPFASSDDARLQSLLQEIRRRLEVLLSVGLDYLSLGRSAETLSTGEAQRVRLTTALSSSLVNALYVFEEPSAHLHPRDRLAVWTQLENLRDQGNTVLLVEHDLHFLRQADYLIDLGPGAGEEGGRLLAQGPPASLRDHPDSITASYLFDAEPLAAHKPRKPEGFLHLKNASLHNLHQIAVDIPLGVLCVVAGVSGAGKSTLVRRLLYPALAHLKGKKGFEKQPPWSLTGAQHVEDVVLMDQEPLPRSQRSNPATYLKIFDDIRALFAETTEARIRNLDPGAFSFNQPGGRCENCQGQGTLTVDMQFLADVTMTCPECLGSRFKKEVLAIQVRGMNISEVLNLTVREAFRFFRAQRAIEKRLKWLLDLGLDYLRLGQPTETLSGGEAQRLKVAGHLAASRKPRNLFILEEPTTGLHAHDVANLLVCFDRLVQTGHSLVVVEHHQAMIEAADYVIELGPGAGPHGGKILHAGPPPKPGSQILG